MESAAATGQDEGRWVGHADGRCSRKSLNLNDRRASSGNERECVQGKDRKTGGTSQEG